MPQSMTGFGQAVGSIYGSRVRIDMRSVNHRYGETVIRLPREWTVLEDTIRKMVSARVERGRVEVYVTKERERSAPQRMEIDWTVADGYFEASQQLKQKYNLHDDFGLAELLALPDVVVAGDETDQVDDSLVADFRDLLEQALVQMVDMRRREGVHLCEDISLRLTALEATHREMVDLADGITAILKSRLQQRISELLQDLHAFDENRFQMEVAVLADRADIHEELTRLDSHFRQFRRSLSQDGAVGRKLDFLLQEMNREANTIGAKAAQTEMTEHVIAMKTQLEKIREQVQNIQ